MDNKTPHNNNLDDLLKKRSSASLDDFEKEALEGFNSLGSEQEALDLKAELDQKIRTELFFEKRKGVRVYWYAAAGLALVIGLSVYLLLSGGALETKKNVAIVQDETAATSPEGMLKEEMAKIENRADDTPPPPSEEKPENEKLNLSQNARTATGKETASAKGKKTVTSTLHEVSDSREGGGLRDDKPAPNKQAEQEPAEKSLERASSKDDGNAKAEGEMNLPENEKTKTQDNNFEQSAKFAGTSKNNPVSPAFTDELKKESKSGSSKAKRKKSMSASTGAEPQAPNREETADAEDLAATTKQEKETDKKDAAKSLPTPSADVTGNNNAGPAGTMSQAYPYQGGEDALKKDLREKLSEADLNKKFDAILYISGKNKVEKVKFIEIYELTSNETEKLENILKSLNKFTSSNQKKFEHTLVYRP